jgi:hypothetical protein
MVIDIDNTGYTLIEKLVEKAYVDNTEQDTLLESVKRKKPELNTYDQLVGNGIYTVIDISGFVTEIWLRNNKKEYGFNKYLYKEFRNVCYAIWDENYSNKCTYEFIENSTFKWLTNVKQKGQAKESLTRFIENELESVSVDTTFYFEIVNIEIDDAFRIGDVTISLYDERKYETHIKSSITNEITKEDIDSAYGRKLNTAVFASTKVYGEPHRAIQIAKDKVTLAVNVIKMFDDCVEFPYRHSKFGLEFKIPYQPKMIHFTEVNDQLRVSVSFEHDDFKISSYELINGFKGIFNLMSKFILCHKKCELNNLVLQSINLYGDAISTKDVHWRGVLLIQLLEFLMLKDDQTSDMEKKAKSGISKLLTNDSTKNKEINEAISHVYQIRHKMVHKARKLQIIEDKYSRTQKHIGEMIMSLVELNGKFETKSELIDYLNLIKS